MLMTAISCFVGSLSNWRPGVCTSVDGGAQVACSRCAYASFLLSTDLFSFVNTMAFVQTSEGCKVGWIVMWSTFGYDGNNK